MERGSRLALLGIWATACSSPLSPGKSRLASPAADLGSVLHSFYPGQGRSKFNALSLKPPPTGSRQLPWCTDTIHNSLSHRWGAVQFTAVIGIDDLGHNSLRPCPTSPIQGDCRPCATNSSRAPAVRKIKLPPTVLAITPSRRCHAQAAFGDGFRLTPNSTALIQPQGSCRCSPARPKISPAPLLV
jgi:hypothetical protein